MVAPPLPDTSQDFCVVCLSRAAPYIFRDRSAGTVQRWCRHHVPEHFGIYKSLVATLEEQLLAEGFGSAKEMGPL